MSPNVLSLRKRIVSRLRGCGLKVSLPGFRRIGATLFDLLTVHFNSRNEGGIFEISSLFKRAGLVLVMSGVLFAQQTKRQVLIPVVAADASGAAVSGLRSGDFSLKLGRRSIIPENTEEVAPFMLPPDKEGKQVMPVFLILDKLSVFSPDVGSVEQSILRFLERSAAVCQPITLLAIDADGLKLVHSFTTPGPVLAAALQLLDQKTHVMGGHYQSAAVGNPTDDSKKKIAQELASLEAFVALGEAAASPMVRIEALRKFGEIGSRLPGRKCAFWVAASHGLRFVPTVRITDPFGKQEAAAFQNAIETLNEGRISIYPVSVPPARPLNPQAAPDPYSAYHFLGEDKAESERALAEIGRATGGELLYFDSDLTKQIQLGLTHFSTYYLLTHQLGPAPKELEWTKLDVKINRSGVRSRSMDGFYDAP